LLYINLTKQSRQDYKTNMLNQRPNIKNQSQTKNSKPEIRYRAFYLLTHLTQPCHSERGTSRGISRHKAGEKSIPSRFAQWDEIPPLQSPLGDIRSG